MRLQKEHWSGNESNGRYHLLSKILKRALINEIISMDDLNKTDYYVINILIKSKDAEITSDLNSLKNFKVAEQISNSEIFFKRKFKHIDPEVFLNETISPLSEVHESYRNFLKIEELNLKSRGIPPLQNL